MKSSGIGTRDLRLLEAVEGWIALGSPREALFELEDVSPTMQSHPQVLDARWQVAAAMRDWDAALTSADRMLHQNPEDPTGWIHRSYALRRCRQGGLQQAWDALLPAHTRFPKISTIPYNMACYAAQMGRLGEAWDWFNRALEAAEDIASIKAMALDDEDLRQIWDRVKAM